MQSGIPMKDKIMRGCEETAHNQSSHLCGYRVRRHANRRTPRQCKTEQQDGERQKSDNLKFKSITHVQAAA